MLDQYYFDKNVCPNCGKVFPTYVEGNRTERKYCSKECWRAFTEKRAKLRYEAKHRHTALSDTLVPQKVCEKCKYHAKYGKLFHCGYMLYTDTTRTSLHPEGLTSDCKEFEPRRRRKQHESS